ncbi:Integral membrane protein TmpA [Quillaja saponaria]|uniref:Integral membrane protein TmpA n=1 Tax=Quillaja saponaria TaxID=32244 RepID=A0AAD7PUR6_QUISA|nr:Integral membrane protein TmpA [Quillaja saponaria]
MQSPVRFSSCRGVAFEIKPHANPFAITKPFAQEPQPSNRFWPFDPSSIERNISKPSSHFCDLELDESQPSSHFCDLELDEDDFLEVIEEEVDDVGKQSKPQSPLPLLVASKREQPTKPAGKKDSRLSIILLDQGLFTVYKRLFVVCLTLNITGLVLAATGNFPYARNRPALFSIGNILALTLCRSEAFLRVVFWLAVKIFGRPWVPLFVKTSITSFLQSLGGIHSGCGISSIAWLIYALVLTLKNRENTSPEIIGVASAILGLLCLTSLASFPIVRHLHHNVFERTHRFAGWTALGLLWAFVILTTSYNQNTKSYTIQRYNLIKQKELWLTVAITILIIFPWLTVRSVPVKVSAPSSHASIIRFEGGVKAGILGRISPSPFSEWHAFGIISDGKREHMMLAGAVGDFTKSLVLNPPSYLWVRQVHFAGLPYLVNMYNKVVLVATGSGICVFLSFLLQPCTADVCLVWVAKGIEQNFGNEIKEMVSGYPKDKVIVHDTAVLGRPNVSQLSVTAAKNWGAEVVVVTSNPEGSRDVVNACKSSGINAFDRSIGQLFIVSESANFGLGRLCNNFELGYLDLIQKVAGLGHRF